MKGESTDDLTLDRLPPCVPAADHELQVVERHWDGMVEIDSAGECALVTSAVHGGAVWHHDRLYDLIEVGLEVDGVAAGARRWPLHPHEQAGSWSSVVDAVALAPGRHTVRARVRTLLPRTVEASTTLWIR